MSNMLPSIDNTSSLDITPSPHHFDSRPSRHHRVLACTSCQQRKVKCDRKFPCSNCVKSRVRCVQATLAPRRRRFSERKLLDRIRKYEDLLRQYKISFEPLHLKRGEDSSNVDASDDSHDERMEHPVPKAPSSSVREKAESSYEAKCVYAAGEKHNPVLKFYRNVFHAMSQAVRLQDIHLKRFIHKDHSFETPIMIAIPPTMIYGRRLLQRSVTEKLKMTSIFYSTLFKNPYTFFLYTPNR
jgi:hypothetical protein